MNILEQTPAAIQVRISGMTWEQVREMIEERFGALMWDHRGISHPADGVTVQMVFAEPTKDVSKRALSNAPQPPAAAQEPAREYPPLPKHLVAIDQTDDEMWGALQEHAWDSNYTLELDDPLYTLDQMIAYVDADRAACTQALPTAQRGGE